DVPDNDDLAGVGDRDEHTIEEALAGQLEVGLADPAESLAGATGEDHGVEVGDAHASSRRHVPLRPPVFSRSCTSVMWAQRSFPLTMSMTARAATETQVSASISTP